MERESTSRGGRHEGHHHQTGYAVSVVLDRGKVNGQRRREWHSGYTSKKAAERALAALLKELDDRQHVEPDKITVGAYLEDRWLPWLKVQAKKPRTYGYHRNNVRGHLLPGIGSIRLQELDAAHLDRLYADLLDQGLAKITVFHVHQTIRKALGQARKWKLVPVNVAGDASPPQPRPWPMTIWSAPELRAFLEGVRSDRPFALWLLASSTGMRRGELLNLRWQDVDLAAGRLGVADAKTDAGRRSIALDLGTVGALNAWRTQQLQERLAWGDACQDTGLALTREDGTRLQESYVDHYFQRLISRAACPRSGSTISGTATRRSGSWPASRPRSCPSGWGTARSA
jgi:integrase